MTEGNCVGVADGGNPEEIEDLINDGANLNFYNKLGNNAFQEACARGQIQCKS